MKIENLKKDLEWRGLLKDIANEDSLVNIVEQSGKFYIGIDPTADSIHVGHFLSLSLARILNEHGLQPIIVLGGFTGMIGDPSGRNSEREVIDREEVAKNVLKIKNLIDGLAKKMGIKDYEIFNNNDIYENMSIIDLYQNYGKLFNINNMLNKESVQNRIENGISYTEFSYQVFQAIDFKYLFENKGVRLQLGGSDQWGNIVAGIDLIRKTMGSEEDVAGITINLLTDENGNKVGKTQGVPMWLDQNKTSSYELYQFFINQTDITADKLLRQGTNIAEEEYIKVKEEHERDPKSKAIHNKLAELFISTVHSVEDYSSAKELSKLLFEERYNDIKENDIINLKSIPSINNKVGETLMDLLIEGGLTPSRREFRDLLKSGAVKVNGESIEDENFKLTDQFIIDKVAFINLGKKNKYIIWK